MAVGSPRPPAGGWWPYGAVTGFVAVLVFITLMRETHVLEPNVLVLHTLSFALITIGFSSYFSLRTNYLHASRQADMQVVCFALQSEHDGPSSGHNLKMAKYWLAFSEDYRRVARVRGYCSLVILYSGGILVASLSLAILTGSRVWPATYTLSVWVFMAALTVPLTSLGFKKPNRFLDRLPPRKWLRLPLRWEFVDDAVGSNSELSSFYSMVKLSEYPLGELLKHESKSS